MAIAKVTRIFCIENSEEKVPEKVENAYLTVQNATTSKVLDPGWYLLARFHYSVCNIGKISNILPGSPLNTTWIYKWNAANHVAVEAATTVTARESHLSNNTKNCDSCVCVHVGVCTIIGWWMLLEISQMSSNDMLKLMVTWN